MTNSQPMVFIVLLRLRFSMYTVFSNLLPIHFGCAWLGWWVREGAVDGRWKKGGMECMKRRVTVRFMRL